MIRNQFSLLVLLLLTGNTFAQITVTDIDIIDVGDIIYQATDSIPGAMITLGNSGANQSWDFSSLQEMTSEIIEVISSVGTPYESMHPNADLCVEMDGELLYLDKTSNGIEMVGYGEIPANMLLIPLPLIYGLNHQDGPNTVMDSVFTNMFIADSLAPYISLNPLYDQIDSLKLKVVITSDFTVDAWGDIMIPLGSFDALRVKVEETTTTEFYTYCSSSVGSGGGWFTAPEQLVPIETESDNRYQWWTNDPTVKFMLAELEVDSVDNIELVTFLTNSNVALIEEKQRTGVNVFPNPTINHITIETQNNKLAALNLVDVNGKFVLNKRFSQTTSLDLSKIAKGIYYLNVSTSEGKLTKKVIIE